MFGAIKNFVSQTTMYRSMLYYLASLLGLAIVLSAYGTLPYDPLDILLTTLVLLLTCELSNRLLANLFGVSPNPESSYITALILAVLFGPLSNTVELGLLAVIGAIAMASKYLLRWHGNHTFNPAAFAAVVGAVFLGQGASWWIGSIYLLPAVVLGGLAMVFRIRRWHLVFSFLAAYGVLGFMNALLVGAGFGAAFGSLKYILLYSPILFFTFVMLVEPLTSPGQRKLRVYYGLIVATSIVAIPYLLPGIGYTLELSLLAGNVFAVLTSNKGWLRLKLVRKQELAPNIFGFWFKKPSGRSFEPGQFMQWSLPHKPSDSRGNRRYFTIASSPTEKELLLVTRFSDKASSFKQKLAGLKPGDEVVASRVEGDFILPMDKTQPIVLIAGGIGITPYRSIIKYLLDRNEARPITMIYGAGSTEELMFQELFAQAKKSLGLQTIYVAEDAPRGGAILRGRIDKDLIKQTLAQAQNQLFYVSGPEPMVKALSGILKELGISSSHIKQDFFPGYPLEG